MKKNIYAIALICLATFIVASCSKSNNSSSNSASATQANLSQGIWRITLYNDSGVDELYHFTGYEFTFNNGAITAQKAGSTVTGSYSSGTDDSQQKLILNFGNTVPFDELNDDWHVVESTTTKIRLEDVSGGNGGTDLLTFEKK